MAHEEAESGASKKGDLKNEKFSINNSQFFEFSVAEFGPRHSRINEQQMVRAHPIHGESALLNAKQCAGRIVVMKRGRCRFAEKALRAQESGALALVIINHADDGERAKPVRQSRPPAATAACRPPRGARRLPYEARRTSRGRPQHR